MMNPKWDQRFLDLARHVAGWSKDPSTQVGAVVVRPDRTIASLGFNGFARGVEDHEARYADRETKYEFVVHAEVNAILAAREPLHGYTLYTWPFAPCHNCGKLVIQAGIKRIVAPEPSEELRARWGRSNDLAVTMFREAGVSLEHAPALQ